MSATVDALREILDDPSLPVGGTGARIAALREAHDYLVSRRAAADVDSLVADLAQVDQALVATLRWHSILVPALSALPPSRPRNAVLGDVHRGELLTWADTVHSWAWRDDAPPRPFGRVDAEFELDEFPGLYDAILLWDKAINAIVVLPTHRERVSWEQTSDRWTVRLAGATLHADELIPVDTDPRNLREWGNS